MSLDEYRNQLIHSQLRLVKIIAGSIRARLPPWVPVEDLIQAGYLALCNAAERFDPARGVEFATYAKYRIRGGILDHIRTRSQESSRETELVDDVLGGADLSADAEAIERSTQIRRAVAKLPGVQRQVMELALEGLANVEIAKRTGSTPGAVYQAKLRAMKQLEWSLRRIRPRRPNSRRAA